MSMFNNYDDNMDDCIQDIKDTIGMLDLNGKNKDKETFVLSRYDVLSIKEKLDDILSLYDILVTDADSKDYEIEELQDRLDRAYETIPERVGEMLNGSYFDVGTVIDLENKISETLKEHGY